MVIDGEEKIECSVCFSEELKDGEKGMVLAVCAHKFHAACAREWFRNSHATCPLCRAVVRADDRC